MTSTISTLASVINVNYPVAGVANDSQGFRDNFSAIKDSLDQASTEVTALQDYTAKINTNNDFAGNTLEDYVALREQTTGYQFSSSLGTGTVTLDWANGSYQYCTTSGTSGERKFAFSNFGTAGSAAYLTLEVNLTAGTNYLTFDTPVVKPSGPSDWTSVFTASSAKAAGTWIFKLMTRDAGTTVYLLDYKYYL